MSAVSATNALLLPLDASLRYTPDGISNDSPSITYRGWDGITGSAGTYVDITSTGTGGTTPYSVNTDTATLTVQGTASFTGYVYLDTANTGAYASSDWGSTA